MPILILSLIHISYEVGSDIAHPDAFLLRSQKLQGIDVPASLLAVARAGAGVNNVPVAEYGKQGIVVFNTPGANCLLYTSRCV